jgi:hypothetical protein
VAHPLHIRLLLDPDTRLAAAAGGAARYFADAAGLSNDVILELQSAVLAACKYCFTSHQPTETCNIAFKRYEDRIQVELSVPGEQSPSTHQPPPWPGVDEVHADNLGVLRLTKFLPPADPATR